MVVGADCTPLTPVRLLDTRHAVGVTTTPPVAAGADLVLPIPSVAGVPAADISAVVAHVTVTQPTTGGHLTVYPDNGGGVPTASNLNFTAGRTVPNLVTVPVDGGEWCSTTAAGAPSTSSPTWKATSGADGIPFRQDPRLTRHSNSSGTAVRGGAAPDVPSVSLCTVGVVRALSAFRVDGDVLAPSSM
ncbi:hypothetical protein [Streptomyces sp. NPDC050287]|uniref:hypothetical protein n=1 Tax=Streptomyces sp. NPDC050287 TaxID=3365608 RepID=UPI0037B75E87